MTYFAFFLSSFLTIASLCVFGQDVPAKIDALNTVLGKDYTIFNKGNKLIIEGFREGKPIKIDKVNIFDLDLNTIQYSEKDGTVSVGCNADADDCVSRVLLRDKEKRYRKRIVFGADDKVAAEKIVLKLKLLLHDMTEKY